LGVFGEETEVAATLAGILAAILAGTLTATLTATQTGAKNSKFSLFLRILSKSIKRHARSYPYRYVLLLKFIFYFLERKL